MGDLKFSKEYNILENVHEEVNFSDKNNYKTESRGMKTFRIYHNTDKIEKIIKSYHIWALSHT